MTNRFRAIILTLFFCLTLCLVLNGCKRTEKTDKKNDAITLTYYHITPFEEDFKISLQKKTGINVNFIPMSDHGDDTLNLLLSSSSLPDIIEYDWNDYKYSPQWLIDYGYLYELNPLIEEYSPHFYKFLNENPSMAKQLRSTRGKYYAYPLIRHSSYLSGLKGLIIREDWLKDLGLPIPVTIDDFEKVLLAFKSEKNAVYPFVDHAAFESILSAFGIRHGFYLDGKNVRYGSGEASFKDALRLLKRWHEMGLINSDGRMSLSIVQQYLINGKSGMAFGYAGSLLDTVNSELKNENSDFRFCGIPNPVLHPDSKPISFAVETAFAPSAAITTSCEFPELAAGLLDYGYSPEGQLFYNYGIWEDISSTDFSVASSSNMTSNKYIRSYITGPFLQQSEYFEQYLHNGTLKEASKIWTNDCRSDMVLPILQFTNEEHEEAVSIEKEITAYVDDMFFRFIIGSEDLEVFDSYISKLEQMQLGRLLEIYQTAYERYLDTYST